MHQGTCQDMPTTRKYPHILHLKPEALISVFPKPPDSVASLWSSMVSSPYSQTQGLAPWRDSFSSITSGVRSLFAKAAELKWKLSTMLTPHIDDFPSSEWRTKTLHGSRFADYPTWEGRQWTGENMLLIHGHLIWKESTSSWEDNFRPFISVSFPLEFSSTNQSYPPVHDSPTCSVLSLLLWTCWEICRCFLVRQASPNAITQLLGQTVHTDFISWPYDTKSWGSSGSWKAGSHSSSSCPLVAIWQCLFHH